jgi:plastocyanin
MKKICLLLIICIVVNIGILSGCTQQQSPPPVATNTIKIINFTFEPSNITVKVGANVTWINEDSAPHQVKEDTGLFLSSPLTNGQSFTYQFNTPGIFNYTCSIHNYMKGKVIVE